MVSDIRGRETQQRRPFNPAGARRLPVTWPATPARLKLGAVSEMPLHTRRLCENALTAYCARICPPAARNAVSIGFAMEQDRATLFEWRPICGVPGTRRALAVAQLRWTAQDNLWRLYRAVDGDQWRRVQDVAATHTFIDLLRTIDADPQGHFFGHVNGKSLRWCSSRGRCADCDEKYHVVLGLRAPALAAGS